MDDIGTSAWQIDPETRLLLRLERVRAAVRDGSWSEATLEAEELLDEDPDHPEGLYLLGEALLQLGEYELAHATCSRRIELDGGDNRSLLGLAIAAFHLCDLPTAAETAREVIRRDPGDAEAHWTLGLALERLPGRQAESLAALTAAAHLDPDRFPLPMTLSGSDWEAAVGQALDLLHPRLQAFWSGVPFRVEPLPSMAELQQHDPPLSPTIGALYVGEPGEGADPWFVRPEAVRLFSTNLGRAPSLEGLIEELAHALQEEALEWLGIDPQGLDGEEAEA